MRKRAIMIEIQEKTAKCGTKSLQVIKMTDTQYFKTVMCKKNKRKSKTSKRSLVKYKF